MSQLYLIKTGLNFTCKSELIYIRDLEAVQTRSRVLSEQKRLRLVFLNTPLPAPACLFKQYLCQMYKEMNITCT